MLRLAHVGSLNLTTHLGGHYYSQAILQMEKRRQSLRELAKITELSVAELGPDPMFWVQSLCISPLGCMKTAQSPHFCRGELAPKLVFIPAALKSPLHGSLRCCSQKCSGRTVWRAKNCPVVGRSEEGHLRGLWSGDITAPADPIPRDPREH